MECVGKNGRSYQIEDKHFAGGGEGNIHFVINDNTIVAKIFKKDKRDKVREEKLSLMIQQKFSGEQLRHITWPLDVLYEENQFVGYIMPKANNVQSLTALYSSDSYDLRYRLMVAINLCIAIETIHSNGQVCGDMNPQNICVNLDKNDRKNGFQVTLVDTDSYHFVTPEKTYRCEVGLADYLAPEIQKKLENGVSLKDAELPTYSRKTDLFALAVHIFCLLMNGCHPFACARDVNGIRINTMQQMQSSFCQDSVVAPQPIDNIKNGFFPFYDRREGVTIPAYAPLFESLPENIRKLFIRTFVDGYSNPKCRVEATEWIDELKSLMGRFTQCISGHYYFDHNEKCPFCETNNRILVAFSNNNEPQYNVPPIEETPSDYEMEITDEQEQQPEKRKLSLGQIILIVIACTIIVASIMYNEKASETKVTVAQNSGKESSQSKKSAADASTEDNKEVVLDGDDFGEEALVEKDKSTRKEEGQENTSSETSETTQEGNSDDWVMQKDDLLEINWWTPADVQLSASMQGGGVYSILKMGDRMVKASRESNEQILLKDLNEQTEDSLYAAYSEIYEESGVSLVDSPSVIRGSRYFISICYWESDGTMSCDYITVQNYKEYKFKMVNYESYSLEDEDLFQRILASIEFLDN